MIYFKIDLFRSRAVDALARSGRCVSHAAGHYDHVGGRVLEAQQALVEHVLRQSVGHRANPAWINATLASRRRTDATSDGERVYRKVPPRASRARRSLLADVDCEWSQ